MSKLSIGGKFSIGDRVIVIKPYTWMGESPNNTNAWVDYGVLVGDTGIITSYRAGSELQASGPRWQVRWDRHLERATEQSVGIDETCIAHEECTKEEIDEAVKSILHGS